MKKNVLLFLVICSLLFIAYFLESRDESEEKQSTFHSLEVEDNLKSILASVRILDELEMNPSYFEDKALALTSKGATVTLGVFNKITGFFYLKIDSKVYLVTLDKKQDIFYKSELERNALNYEAFKKALKDYDRNN